MFHATILVFIGLAVVAVNAYTAAQLKHQNETLALHNSLRASHCVPALQLDENLNKIAQAYADYLAQTGKFQHSNNGHGENLYMMGSSQAMATLDGKLATQSWYDEIKDYNYGNPTFSAKTGHFTQVVWKGSTKLGVGLGFSSDKKKAYVVANYSPPGNYMGQFPTNVNRKSC